MPGSARIDPQASKEELVVEADLEMAEESELGKKIEDRLRKVFEPMEIWYLRSSIEKVGLSFHSPLPL